MLALLVSPTALVAHSPLPSTRGAYAATPAMSSLSRANPAVMIVVPPALQHGQSAALAQCTLELGSCASSGRAWRLWVARYSQEGLGPPVSQPLLKLATSKAADLTFSPPSTIQMVRGAIVGGAAVGLVKTLLERQPKAYTTGDGDVSEADVIAAQKLWAESIASISKVHP